MEESDIFFAAHMMNFCWMQSMMQAVYDSDDELTAETKLARAKYEFLYREAKLRKVHGRMQSSVFGK